MESIQRVVQRASRPGSRVFLRSVRGYRQETSIPLNANVPTPLFRSMTLAALPFDETKLFLDQFPAPTEPFAGDALAGVFIGPGAKNNSDEHVDFRTDIRLATGNLSGTFTGGHPYLAQASVLPDRLRVWKSLTRRATASYALARGRWSSEPRFGYRYNWLSRTNPYFNVTDPSRAASENREDHRGVSRLGYPGLTNPEGEQHVRGTVPSYTVNQYAPSSRTGMPSNSEASTTCSEAAAGTMRPPPSSSTRWRICSATGRGSRCRFRRLNPPGPPPTSDSSRRTTGA